MAKKNPQVDEYLNRTKSWQKELKKLRSVLLSCGLTEELKWRQPCYTHDKSNIVILQAFKNECRMMFFKGALLKDAKKVLREQGENTQSARIIPFANVNQIVKMESIIKSYIREAIELEESGAKVTFKKASEFKVPQELKDKFQEIPLLEDAFKSLTPGRQRAYLLHFSGAKQSKTREARIEKYVDRILDGIGLNDDYTQLKNLKRSN